MKRMQLLVLCSVLVVVLLSILGLRSAFNQFVWDATHVEIENSGETLESISFEEAAILQAACTSTDQGTAQAQLLELEKKILEETGKDAQYYRFTGTFSLKGLEAQGTLTSLIVAVEDTQTYIYSACDPFVELLTENSRITWRDGYSYHAVSGDKRSVRLAAVGQLGIKLKSVGKYPLTSNMLYPIFQASF